MAKYTKIPKYVTLGPFRAELALVPPDIMYDVADAQGTFVCRPPYKIFLDRDIIEKGGPDAVNVMIHECMHIGYYQYQLKDKEEETVVNSFANFLTELLCRSELSQWFKENMKGD